jgi:hypothetical protein
VSATVLRMASKTRAACQAEPYPRSEVRSGQLVLGRSRWLSQVPGEGGCGRANAMSWWLMMKRRLKPTIAWTRRVSTESGEKYRKLCACQGHAYLDS